LGMGKLYYCTVTTGVIVFPAESGVNLEPFNLEPA